MQRHQDKLRCATIGLLCLLCIGFGLYAWQLPMLIAGAVGIVYTAVATTLALCHLDKPPLEAPLSHAVPAAAAELPADTDDTAVLVRRMLAQSRHALLLRKQVVGNLSQDQFFEACEQLHARMGLVPEGEVILRKAGDDDESELAGPATAAAEWRMHVAAVFLDRCAVTNRQYYEFVAAGGYRDMTLWDQQAWPAVLDLVDQTGKPGPAFWQQGHYLPGEDDLPVVGVSWYEAQACARWLGKRLPTGAEWVKAACWPVATDGTAMIQRRFPWGDSLDRSRANLWGSGPNHIVAVDEFPSGASVGGIYQMVGNVWEWNASDFRLGPQQSYGGGAPLKSIRGGAFDTYLDNQATCQFESGEYPLSRRHNIGFRCAIGTCDLVLALPRHEALPIADAEPSRREALHV